MGLFDGKKIADIEEEITEKMSKLDILSNLVYTITNTDKEWVHKCQGFYDSLERKVIIGRDLFQIQWVSKIQQGGEIVEELNEELSYSNTASGYTPIHAHFNEKGKEDVTFGRVVYLWSNIVLNALKQAMPECRFSDVTEETNGSYFTYCVPAKQWKRWF